MHARIYAAASFPANQQKVKVKTELANTQKELENVKDSEEMQGMIIGPLEEMRREMKGILLATKVGTVLKAQVCVPLLTVLTILWPSGSNAGGRGPIQDEVRRVSPEMCSVYDSPNGMTGPNLFHESHTGFRPYPLTT